MKKAKLDIWEDISDIEPEMSGTQIPLTHGVEAPVKSAGKWAFNKLLLIGAPLALVVLIACGFLVFYLIRNVAPGPQPPATISKAGQEKARQAPVRSLPEKPGIHENTRALAMPEKTTILYLKDFMIDLKDASGKNHLLICDVAFDMHGEKKHEQLENVTVLRNIIYKSAQSRSVVALRSVEERKKLKKEMAFALEKMLGEGTVKNVYFMNYFIM